MDDVDAGCFGVYFENPGTTMICSTMHSEMSCAYAGRITMVHQTEQAAGQEM
jgi:hypothetical protein